MGKTLKWYLEKGFDLEVAKYFADGAKKIICADYCYLNSRQVRR